MARRETFCFKVGLGPRMRMDLALVGKADQLGCKGLNPESGNLI